jgi:pSer/pThr/pTyr-binding forkhead associated (FHA) protein
MCDLVLDDPDVSRRHAQFMILDSKAWIVDLGSANGTLVDGAMVRRVRLQEGSEIVVGSVRMSVRAATIDDTLLPAGLMADWQGTENGSTPSRSEHLRRLSGAQTCAWADGGHPVLQWPDNGRWEELGPVRRQLVEALTG